MLRPSRSPTKRRPAEPKLPSADELLQQSGGSLQDGRNPPTATQSSHRVKPARVRYSQEKNFKLWLEEQCAKSQTTLTTTARTASSARVAATSPGSARAREAASAVPFHSATEPRFRNTASSARTASEAARAQSKPKPSEVAEVDSLPRSITMTRQRNTPEFASERENSTSEEVSDSHSKKGLNAGSDSSSESNLGTPPKKALGLVQTAPSRGARDSSHRLDKAVLKGRVHSSDLILLKSVFRIKAGSQPDFSRVLHTILSAFTDKQRDALKLLSLNKSISASSALQGWADFIRALDGCVDFVRGYIEKSFTDSREGSGEEIKPCCLALMSTAEFSTLFTYVKANPNL